MSDNSESLKNLQTALAMELTAAHQYLLHAHTLEDWGLNRLSAQMREEFQEEIGHADTFIRRIVFLKGSPEMMPAKAAKKAPSLEEMFLTDLADEKEAIEFYTRAARAAGEAGDIGTRKIFEDIVLDEEGHMGWLELQLDLLKRMGEPAYIATQMTPSGNGEAD